MRTSLLYLTERNYFEHRKGGIKDADGRIVKIGWIEAGMALKSAYGDEVGFELWGVTHIDDTARKNAPAQWASFAAVAQAGQVTIATIIKAARDAGLAFGLASASATPPTSAPEQFTGQGADVWNGKKFASLYRGTLLLIHETDEWLKFVPLRGWMATKPGIAERCAKEVLRRLRDEAAARWTANPLDAEAKRMLAHVERTSLAKTIFAMIEMAASEPGMTAQLTEFDADHMLLGVANGVLDLRAGTLVAVGPEVLVSKRCNVAYDPARGCPRFERFLLEVQPDAKARGFLQRLVGYCLTGNVSAQMFVFFYGHGANGKSVFVEIIAWLLGDYARKIQTEMLMRQRRNPQGPSLDIVSLKGVRFAYANETGEGVHLDEARVKELTGGDTLTGRAPYGKADISFRPSHKLCVVGNHKPEIADTSFGMWRRVVLTPFDQTIPEANRDPHLLETLKEEGPGILNWALVGLLTWQKIGLQIPKSIADATATYRNEQDMLGDWIGENCVTGSRYREAKSVLYENYKRWAEQNGHRPLAQGRLTRRLKELASENWTGR